MAALFMLATMDDLVAPVALVLLPFVDEAVVDSVAVALGSDIFSAAVVLA